MSNLVATNLHSIGIRKGCIIAFLLDYNEEIIISILGILKAGGAYLPLDIQYPESSIHYILHDSNVDCMIKSTTYKLKEKIICRTVLFADLIKDLDGSYYEETACSQKDAAYVIYTSGTTGEPKGVLVDHKSIINYTLWKIKQYNFHNSDIHLQLLSPAFDAFGSNFYPSILSGGAMVMLDPKILRESKLANSLINQYRITSMSVVPIFYQELVNHATKDDMHYMQKVFLGGEEADDIVISASINKFPQIKIYNEYGPTEATIAVASGKINNISEKNCIGNPIDNIQIHILDQTGGEVPEGMTGEIYISGQGLARGYINQPEMTHRKFIKLNKQRVYRSGDYGRRNTKGSIELIGRKDCQVKVNGYRIDLRLIKKTLRYNPIVKDVEVVVYKNHLGYSLLCAFIITTEQFNEEDFKVYLRKHLPEYMIPHKYLQLEDMPVTISGKIDYQTLHQIYIKNIQSNQKNELVNETENKIIDIWKEVLGIASVQSDINFFDAGGNSILLMKVQKKLVEIYSDQISVLDLFTYTTISKLAFYIDSLMEKDSMKTT